jgi:hypothetical protein
MMKAPWILQALLLVTACAPSGETSSAKSSSVPPIEPQIVAPAPSAESLLALERQANDAYIRGDAEYFEGLLSDKFVMLGPGGTRMDRAATTGRIAGVRCEIVGSWTLDEPHLTKVAADTFVFSYRSSGDGSCSMAGESARIPSPVRAATVWFRSGDKWMVAFHGENPILDPAAAKPAETAIAPAPSKTAPKGKSATAGDAASDTAAADPETAALVAIETALWEAWKNHDRARIEELTASELAFVDIFGNVTAGRAETIELWSGNACDVQSVRVADGVSTAISPTVRRLTFRGLLGGTCGGEEFPEIFGTSVYVLEEGVWKLAFTMNQLAG